MLAYKYTYKSRLSLEELLDQVPPKKGKYQRLVGRLIYISHIQLNIAYISSEISYFMHNASEVNMNIGFRILRYMKLILGKVLRFLRIIMQILLNTMIQIVM